MILWFSTEALGQFVLYAHLLMRHEIDLTLYLTVPEEVRKSVFEEEAGQILIQDGLIDSLASIPPTKKSFNGFSSH